MPETATISRPQVDDEQAAQVVADVIEAMLSQTSRSLEFKVWSAIKAQRAAGTREANFIEDMVRSGQPIHRFVDTALAQDDALRKRYQEAQSQITASITNGLASATTGGNGQQLLRQHDTSRVGGAYQG